MYCILIRVREHGLFGDITFEIGQFVGDVGGDHVEQTLEDEVFWVPSMLAIELTNNELVNVRVGLEQVKNYEVYFMWSVDVCLQVDHAALHMR